MLSRTIENAQKKVEQQNFLIRKRVLEYDDVLNQQREVIYKYRREILEGRDMSERRQGGAARACSSGIVAGVHARRLHRGLGRRRALRRRSSRSSTPSFGADDAPGRGARPRRARRTGCTRTRSSATREREEELGEELMRNLERAVLLQIIDSRWREHLSRHGLPARGHPPARLRTEGPAGRVQERGLHALPRPDELDLGGLRRYIFHVEVEIEPAEAEIAFTPSSRSSSTRGLTYTGGGPEQPSALYDAAEQAGVPAASRSKRTATRYAALPEVETRHVDERDKIGRNDPCWCGSGKKYKKCHGA